MTPDLTRAAQIIEQDAHDLKEMHWDKERGWDSWDDYRPEELFREYVGLANRLRKALV